MKRNISTDRQLAWWITHLKRRWKEEGQMFWTIQINAGHWASLWLSKEMIRSLSTHRTISRKYRVRILSAYADLPRRLEVQTL